MITTPARRIGATLAVLGVLGLAAVSSRAADHADAPATSENNLDINDVYAFNQGDDVVFIMTVAPLITPGEATANAALNPRGLYEFKLDAERDGNADAVIQVAARGSGPDQIVTFRGPSSPIRTGTRSVVVAPPAMEGGLGETVEAGGITAWAGVSDDPFYINLFGDESLTSVLNAAYGAALGTQIGASDEQTLAFEDPAADDLAGLNTISIVVQIPKSQVASALGIPVDGTFFLWGSTSIR